ESRNQYNDHQEPSTSCSLEDMCTTPNNYHCQNSKWWNYVCEMSFSEKKNIRQYIPLLGIYIYQEVVYIYTTSWYIYIYQEVADEIARNIKAKNMHVKGISSKL
ncbi:MAG: hypothetical protein O7D30_10760, partial [Rickettsia endosymbiont of Ixodes persulcatus]|nr:hypothetical protein [Rickettsia endosymbiont of Ixodes persulcatus]